MNLLEKIYNIIHDDFYKNKKISHSETIKKIIECFGGNMARSSAYNILHRTLNIIKNHKDAYPIFVEKHKKLIENDYKKDDEPMSEITEDFSNNKGFISSKNFNVKTLDDLLRVTKVDLKTWEVERHVINKWEFGSNLDGEIITKELYQIKAWLKKKKENRQEEYIETFKKELSKLGSKTVPKIKYNPSKNSGLYEISCPDLHIGKLCWGKETNFEDYDQKMAIELYETAVDNLLSAIPHERIDKILLPTGNDFFNVDSHLSTTTSGTPQSEDSRWQKSYIVGCKLMVDTIEKLTSIAPVDVVIVSGNHDYQRSFYLGSYLEAWFRSNKNVNIDNKPTYRKYYRYYNNLIGFTHGNEEKISNLPTIMATEAKQDWADTDHKEYHCGHFHGEQIKEFYGVTIRFLPSLCSTDAWHSKKGYIGNTRAAQSFFYDKKNGMIFSNYFKI